MVGNYFTASPPSMVSATVLVQYGTWGFRSIENWKQELLTTDNKKTKYWKHEIRNDESQMQNLESWKHAKCDWRIFFCLKWYLQIHSWWYLLAGSVQYDRLAPCSLFAPHSQQSTPHDNNTSLRTFEKFNKKHFMITFENTWQKCCLPTLVLNFVFCILRSVNCVVTGKL